MTSSKTSAKSETDLDALRPVEDNAWGKRLVLVVLAIVILIGFLQFGDLLTLESLAEREAQLRTLQRDVPALVYGAAFLVYVCITGLSLPGAAPLTLLYGWYFGLVEGVVLVSFASTLGAALAFLLSRYLLRDSIENRFRDRSANFQESMAREGPFFLFTLRLIPAVPFFVINAVMGLTPIRTWTFWWVSQLGMLPGTIVYVYAGSQAPTIEKLADDGVRGILTWELMAAFALLGTFPWILRYSLAVLTGSRVVTETTEDMQQGSGR